MRRFFITLPVALVMLLGVAAPVYAANLPLLDPNFSIVPQQCQACPAAYGCVLQLIQNLMNAAIAIGIVAFVLVAVYAGANFMLNPTNPEIRSKARGMLLNVVVGMIIVLASWIFVDFIMKTLYNSGSYGPWNSILSEGSASQCIQATKPVKINGIGGGIATGLFGGSGDQVSNTPNSGTYGTTGAQCSVSNQACSVNTLQGLGLSSSQSNIMSCIAVTESSGNPGTPPYNQTHPGSNSSACGTFQITQTTWNRTAGGSCSSFSNCTNASCNAQVAAALVRSSGYSSWTCPGCNNKAQGCIAKYSGS